MFVYAATGGNNSSSSSSVIPDALPLLSDPWGELLRLAPFDPFTQGEGTENIPLTAAATAALSATAAVTATAATASVRAVLPVCGEDEDVRLLCPCPDPGTPVLATLSGKRGGEESVAVWNIHPDGKMHKVRFHTTHTYTYTCTHTHMHTRKHTQKHPHSVVQAFQFWPCHPSHGCRRGGGEEGEPSTVLQSEQAAAVHPITHPAPPHSSACIRCCARVCVLLS